MAEVIHELLLPEAAVEKLGARDISDTEARQLLCNARVTVHNPGADGNAKRRLLIGRTDGGRILTLVVEETIEPTSWVIITGWTAAIDERKMLGG